MYHEAVEILITLTNNLDIIEFLTMEYTRAQVLHVGNMFELILYFMIKMYYLLHGFTYSCNIGSSILFITSILVGLNFRRLLDIYGANVVVWTFYISFRVALLMVGFDELWNRSPSQLFPSYCRDIFRPFFHLFSAVLFLGLVKEFLKSNYQWFLFHAQS